MRYKKILLIKNKLFSRGKFRISFIGGALIIIAILISLFLYFRSNTIFQKGTPSLPLLAKKVVETCKDFKYRPGCYEKEIPKLMYEPYFLTMNQAFEVTANVQKIDTGYGYCHVTGHKLSQQEVRKDPNNWKSVLTKCPVEGCAHGCIHGVFMEKFNTETFNEQQMDALAQELKTVCEKNDIWNPTPSETNGCFHALGHAVMYLTGADVNRSIKFCYEIGKRNSNDITNYFNCYQGIFMQIFQPLEKEDKELVAHIQPQTQEEAVKFCSRTKDISHIACLNQTWPLFFKQFKNPGQLADYCQYFEPKYKNYCYTTAINILTSNLGLDVDYMFNYCSNLINPSPGECLGQSAGRMFEIDEKNKEKAIDLCKRGIPFDPDGKCFKMLINYSNRLFRNPQSERAEFCKSLPSEWLEKCLGN